MLVLVILGIIGSYAYFNYELYISISIGGRDVANAK